MDAGVTAKSCTVNGVNVVVCGGIDIPYLCTEASRRGVRVDWFFLWLYSFFGLVDCYSKKTVPQITYFTQTLKIN